MQHFDPLLLLSVSKEVFPCFSKLLPISSSPNLVPAQPGSWLVHSAPAQAAWFISQAPDWLYPFLLPREPEKGHFRACKALFKQHLQFVLSHFPQGPGPIVICSPSKHIFSSWKEQVLFRISTNSRQDSWHSFWTPKHLIHLSESQKTKAIPQRRILSERLLFQRGHHRDGYH